MRAIPILGEESLDLARAYRGVADFLLLDSHHAGDRQIGALGCTHDWRISRRIVNVVASRPFSRVASTPKMSSTRSPQSAPRVWIPRQKQTLPTGAARISKRSDVSSTRQAHQVNAVARNSTAPLFWITPNSRNRHCEFGAQPDNLSLSSLVRVCGSKITGLPLPVGYRSADDGSCACCAAEGAAKPMPAASSAAAPQRCISASERFQHRLGAGHLVLPRRLDMQCLDDAVFDQHRVAL